MRGPGSDVAPRESAVGGSFPAACLNTAPTQVSSLTLAGVVCSTSAQFASA